MASAVSPLLQQSLAGLQANAGAVPPGGAPAAAAAGPVNPIAMLLARLGAAGGGGPAGPAAPTGDAGGDFAAMMSNVRGADPAFLVRQLKNIQKLMNVMSVFSMNDNPRLSAELSRMVPMFNRAVGEAEKSSNVNAAVRNNSSARQPQPINMGAATPTPQQQPGAMVG